MSEESFRYAAWMLNGNHRRFGSADGVDYLVFNWGIEWNHYDNPLHRHTFYEICYVLNGEGEYEDEETTFKLESGVLFASLPGHWHQIRSRDGLKLFFVAFEVSGEAAQSQAARQYEAELQGIPALVVHDPEGATALLWRGLYRHVLQGRAGGAAQTNALCGMLLRSFPAAFGHTDGAQEQRGKPLSHSRSHLAQLARRYIRDNLSRPLRQDDVASYLGVSVRHLSRIFKEEADESFVDCVTRERMLAAESLLKTTLHSVKEIADLTGYQSVHYFTRVFSDRYGAPPAEYRRRLDAGPGESQGAEP